MKTSLSTFGHVQTVAMAVAIIGISVSAGTAQTDQVHGHDAATNELKSTLQLALRMPTKAAAVRAEIPQSGHSRVVADLLVMNAAHDTNTAGAINFVSPFGFTNSPSGMSRGINSQLPDERLSAARHENLRAVDSLSGFPRQPLDVDDAARFLAFPASARWGVGDANTPSDPRLGRNKGLALFTIKL